MVVKLYVSGISGNKEVKKKQQRVQMILDSKSIRYETIDITEPGKEKDKEMMQQKAKIRDVLGRHPLPPQIFNDEDYCGDYEDFDLANEVDELEMFLHLPIPSKLIDTINGSREDSDESHGVRNGAKTTEVNGDVELTSLIPDNDESGPTTQKDAADTEEVESEAEKDVADDSEVISAETEEIRPNDEGVKEADNNEVPSDVEVPISDIPVEGKDCEEKDVRDDGRAVVPVDRGVMPDTEILKSENSKKIGELSRNFGETENILESRIESNSPVEGTDLSWQGQSSQISAVQKDVEVAVNTNKSSASPGFADVAESTVLVSEILKTSGKEDIAQSTVHEISKESGKEDIVGSTTLVSKTSASAISVNDTPKASRELTISESAENNSESVAPSKKGCQLPENLEAISATCPVSASLEKRGEKVGTSREELPPESTTNLSVVTNKSGDVKNRQERSPICEDPVLSEFTVIEKSEITSEPLLEFDTLRNMTEKSDLMNRDVHSMSQEVSSGAELPTCLPEPPDLGQKQDTNNNVEEVKPSETRETVGKIEESSLKMSQRPVSSGAKNKVSSEKEVTSVIVGRRLSEQTPEELKIEDLDVIKPMTRRDTLKQIKRPSLTHVKPSLLKESNGETPIIPQHSQEESSYSEGMKNKTEISAPVAEILEQGTKTPILVPEDIEKSSSENDTAPVHPEGVKMRELVEETFTPFNVDKITYSPQLIAKMSNETNANEVEKGVSLKPWNRRPSEADLVKQVRLLLDERDSAIAYARARQRAGRSPGRDPHHHFLSQINQLIHDTEIEERVDWPVVRPPPKEPTPPPEPPVDDFIQKVLRALNAPYHPKPKPPPEEPMGNVFLNQVKELVNSEQLTGDGQAVYFTKERGPLEDSEFIHKVRVILDERESTLGIRKSPEVDHSVFINDVLVLLNDEPMTQEQAQVKNRDEEEEPNSDKEVVKVESSHKKIEEKEEESPVEKIEAVHIIEPINPQKIVTPAKPVKEIEIAQIFIRDNVFPVVAKGRKVDPKEKYADKQYPLQETFEAEETEDTAEGDGDGAGDAE